MVIAIAILQSEPFKTTSQQSDYLARCNQQKSAIDEVNNCITKNALIKNKAKIILKHYLLGILPLVWLSSSLCRPVYAKRDYISIDIKSHEKS